MATTNNSLDALKASQANEDTAIQALLTLQQNTLDALKALQASGSNITPADVQLVIDDMDRQTAAINAKLNPPASPTA